MNNQKDRVLLIDGLNNAYRANITFGKPKPEDEDKEDFTVVFNFFRNLRATIEQFDPDKVFFALEGGSCFRYDLLPTYKANRILKIGSEEKQKKKDDFNRQYKIILKLLKHLPITQVKCDRYEADDVIATLVSSLLDEQIIIISNDKDYIQLLQKGYNHIKIYSHNIKDFVVAPEYHFLTFLALNGDTSDNIPSIVGKKKAIGIASDPEKLKEFLLIEEQRANYNLNRQLVEFKIIEDDQLVFHEYEVDFDALKEEFEYMDFQAILEDKYWNRFIETFEKLR